MPPDYVSEPPQRRDNGLRADQFVALADVDPRLGEHLLDLLRLAEIAAYLEPTTDPRVASRYPVSGPVERLYVESEQRQQARAVVVAAAHEAGEAAAPMADARPSASPVSPPVSSSPTSTPPASTPNDDVLAGIDLDAEFARIVSSFSGPSAAAAPADVAERKIGINRRRRDPGDPVDGDDPEGGPTSGDITSADLDRAAAEAAHQRQADEQQAELDAELAEDDEEHFHPPPAPPFPVPTANTVGAVLLLVLGLVVLIRGDLFGLGSQMSFPTSVLLLLAGSALIIRGLRDQPDPDEEPDDDGAAV